jgi:hypothetical protein
MKKKKKRIKLLKEVEATIHLMQEIANYALAKRWKPLKNVCGKLHDRMAQITLSPSIKRKNETIALERKKQKSNQDLSTSCPNVKMSDVQSQKATDCYYCSIGQAGHFRHLIK